MRKILVTGAGSPRDPGYDDVKVGGVIDRMPIEPYLKERGIQVIQDLIESCHGCPDLMTKYSAQLQSMVEEGDKVVSVLQGGLLFALPSIQSTQVTFPIISVPLDVTAYTAFMVPSGHAVVGGVGVEIKHSTGYAAESRNNALLYAANILNLEEEGVALEGNGDLGSVINELNALGIPIDKRSKLILTFSGQPPFQEIDSTHPNIVNIWANSERSHGLYPKPAAMNWLDYNKSIQVRGAKNLAIYAAKILSLGNPELRGKLLEMGEIKRAGYEERNLEKELEGI